MPVNRTFVERTKIAIASMAALAVFVFVGTAQAATAVGLGTTESFAILAGAGVTNTGPTVINGDLGTAPTPSVSGFGGAGNGTVNGAVHQADAVATQAKVDLTTAFNDAAGQGPPTTLATQLGGQNLTAGVYDSLSGTFNITGPLTLDAQGDPNAVFIFQTSTTLVTAAASSVQVINGGQSCNVFWKVGSSATLGGTSVFIGNVFADQAISAGSGATVEGRLLARTASVTLDNNTVNLSTCAAAPAAVPADPTPTSPCPRAHARTTPRNAPTMASPPRSTSAQGRRCAASRFTSTV
jgi:hypothetical protein